MKCNGVKKNKKKNKKEKKSGLISMNYFNEFQLKKNRRAKKKDGAK